MNDLSFRQIVSTSFLLLVFALIGCGGNDVAENSGLDDEVNAPGVDEEATDGQATVADNGDDAGTDAATEPSEPDFFMTSVEFDTEYKADPDAAGAKYTGKTIELTGEIINVGMNLVGSHQLLLEGKKEGFDGRVVCFPKKPYPWKIAAPGQTVKIRGDWPSGPDDLAVGQLINCDIIEVTGDPIPNLTADELVKEIEANPAEATEKYKGKYMLMSGEITKKERVQYEGMLVTLKTATGKAVVCQMFGNDPAYTASLAPGQELHVIGKCELSGDKIRIDSCLLDK